MRLFGAGHGACGEQVDGLVYAVGTIQLKGLARLSTEDFLEIIALTWWAPHRLFPRHSNPQGSQGRWCSFLA